MIVMRMVMSIHKEELVDSGGLSVSTTLAAFVASPLWPQHP